ncbi:DUF1841 family protein [Hydromonas duriensis]|uniref:Uncharacterized protein DUF1841 n=1 Tax=Hydromonas duriensis TaxID=1527608 RepID=A0A4R6Y325_9BURK|nr:DUF1841 family protein [Hydromonas duriensis]TDR30917.1 uncharacterized protein DUF1841 [Hydromonas duriensis]
MFFNPTLAEVRQFFYHAWHKFLNNQSLAPMEQMAVHWMRQHDEYHAILNGPIEALEAAQFMPEDGQSNPFLHLSMHLSISEQLSINQPIGIREAYQKLAQKLDDEHAAQHVVMECLGQVLWQAQREQREPDSAAYIDSILKAATSPTSNIH